LKLYNLESCFYCKMVRDKLKALGLEYEKIEVPSWKGDRQKVYEVSGQYLVPVLVDNDLILDDEEKILPYLDKVYGHA